MRKALNTFSKLTESVSKTPKKYLFNMKISFDVIKGTKPCDLDHIYFHSVST
jgi:hypothetical protein